MKEMMIVSVVRGGDGTKTLSNKEKMNTLKVTILLKAAAPWEDVSGAWKALGISRTSIRRIGWLTFHERLM
jgi:hypothetical protein